ncbi:glycosyltransferase [Streptomyces sp. NPDC048349]|uniref:glycosyltransferase n=1 Tax=Streptomyces sp. NPDC048349 TaxID=3155486 RepID=UPI00343002DB
MRAMIIAAITDSAPATGNDTTIRRLAAHVSSAGHEVRLVEAGALPEALAHGAEGCGFDAAIVTHAVAAGEIRHSLTIPYILVFGGTDLNEFSLDPAHFAVMTEAVAGADALVAFNDDFVLRCLALWPDTIQKLYSIPQAVDTDPSDFSLKNRLGLPDDAQVFLLPAGLRPVKDPLFLTGCVDEWQREDPRVHLVIAGVSYDGFDEIVRRRCLRHSGVHYAGALNRRDLHAAMREATAVLNTSISECSPNAVLEAMHLGTPVIARAIPGNTCLVADGITGLLFHSPDEFRKQAQRLLEDRSLAATLTGNARRMINSRHGLADEAAAYAQLLQHVARRSVNA